MVDEHVDAEKVAIEMSRRLLMEHYEQRNMDAVFSCFVDDITWLGPMDCQRCQSVKEMCAILEPEYGVPVRMRDERWTSRRLGNVLVVSGVYSLDALGKDGERTAAFHQNATLV